MPSSNNTGVSIPTTSDSQNGQSTQGATVNGVNINGHNQTGGNNAAEQQTNNASLMARLGTVEPSQSIDDDKRWSENVASRTQ